MYIYIYIYIYIYMAFYAMKLLLTYSAPSNNTEWDTTNRDIFMQMRMPHSYTYAEHNQHGLYVSFESYIYIIKLLIFGLRCFNAIQHFDSCRFQWISRCFPALFHAVSKYLKVFHCCFMMLQGVSLPRFMLFQCVSRHFAALCHAVSRCFTALFHTLSKYFTALSNAVSWCFKVFPCPVSCCFSLFQGISLFCFTVFQAVSLLRFMPFQGVSLPCFILFNDHEAGAVESAAF